MPTLNSPATHGAAQSYLGLNLTYLDAMILQEMAEQFAIEQLLEFWGDTAGTGTNTLAKRRVSGFGDAKSFTAMASEIERITASAISAAVDSLAVARYGLAFSESFQRAGQASDGITLEYIAQSIVASLQKTLRGLAAAQVATFSNNVANTADDLDVDDMIALRAAFEATEGFNATAVINCLFHPVQVTHLRGNMRAETALKFPDRFDADQRVQANAGFRFEFIGMRVFASNSVQSASNTYYGGAWQAGALGWAKMATSGINAGPDTTYVDDYGLIITRETEGATATKRIDANAFVGVGQVDATVAPAFQVRSKTTVA